MNRRPQSLHSYHGRARSSLATFGTRATWMLSQCGHVKGGHYQALVRLSVRGLTHDSFVGFAFHEPRLKPSEAKTAGGPTRRPPASPLLIELPIRIVPDPVIEHKDTPGLLYGDPRAGRWVTGIRPSGLTVGLIQRPQRGSQRLDLRWVARCGWPRAVISFSVNRDSNFAPNCSILI
jgi:hypothetical protein